MIVVLLAALFAVVEVIDFATYTPANELNPIVLGLGPLSVWLKVLLVVYVFSVTVLLLATRKYTRVVPVILAIGIIAGCIGAWSNVR